MAAALVLGAVAWFSDPVDPDRHQFFRLARGGDEIQPLTGADIVAPGEALGVRITAPQGAVVYALSVFGDPDDANRRYVLPATPMLVKDLTSEEVEPIDEAIPPPTEPGITLEPGTHDLFCAVIEPDASGREGLYVFASTSGRSAWLDDWLRAIDEVHDGALPGVPYETAMKLFENFESSTRGGRIQDMSLAERRRVFGKVTRSALEGTAAWTLPDVARYGISCRVASTP